MGCYKPLIRFYVPHDREKSGRVYSLARFSEMIGHEATYEELIYRKDVMMIPCGKCIGCRIQQREDWTTRIELEARSWPKEKVWFITLTYNEQEIPGMIRKTGEIIRGAKYIKRKTETGLECVQTLWYEDIQLFIKRLRKAYREPLRYFVAGEYGEQTGRPHYHAILYGYTPKEPRPIYKTKDNGYITDDWMEKIWGKGNIRMAQATTETYRYVAGYVTKKMGEEPEKYHKLGMRPPFCQMSRKPGIGDAYFQEHREEIWKKGYIQLANGKKASIPRFYEKMLKDEDPEKLWEIKRQRQAKAIEQTRERMGKTDIPIKDYLKNKEQAIKKSSKVRGKL